MNRNFGSLPLQTVTELEIVVAHPEPEPFDAEILCEPAHLKVEITRHRKVPAVTIEE